MFSKRRRGVYLQGKFTPRAQLGSFFLTVVTLYVFHYIIIFFSENNHNTDNSYYIFRTLPSLFNRIIFTCIHCLYCLLLLNISFFFFKFYSLL